MWTFTCEDSLKVPFRMRFWLQIGLSDSNKCALVTTNVPNWYFMCLFAAHMTMPITLRCSITRSDAKPTVSGYDNQTELQSQKWEQLKQDLMCSDGRRSILLMAIFPRPSIATTTTEILPLVA